MTVDRSTEIEIRRLFFAEHWKRGTIAAQLGVHSDVVDRVIGHLGPQPNMSSRTQACSTRIETSCSTRLSAIPGWSRRESTTC
jgi:hypothetical protein